MNNKLKKIIVSVLTLLFAILLLNFFTKGIEKNNSDITNMNILNYIPSNYDLTILSFIKFLMLLFVELERITCS